MRNGDVIEALRGRLERGPAREVLIWLDGKESALGAQDPTIDGDALVGGDYAYALDQIVGFRVLREPE